MKKKSSGSFEKFKKKKNNAAVKEQFRQEKQQWKKEREEFFEKRKSNLKSQTSNADAFGRHPDQLRRVGTSNLTPQTSLMPLNKFIAHCGVCSRRDAAELVKQGKVKVNNEPVT